MLVERRHPAAAHGHRPRRASTWPGRRGAAGRAAQGALAAARGAASSATSRRSSRTRASGTWSTPRRGSCREQSRRALHHRRRRRAARRARAPDPPASSREARHPRRLPPRHPVAAQGLRRVRDELGDRRARHLAARRDGLRQAGRGDQRRRHSRSRRRRRDRPAGAAARSRGAWLPRSSGCSRTAALRERMGAAGLARVPRAFSAETWCGTRSAFTSASR